MEGFRKEEHEAGGVFTERRDQAQPYQERFRAGEKMRAKTSKKRGQSIGPPSRGRGEVRVRTEFGTPKDLFKKKKGILSRPSGFPWREGKKGLPPYKGTRSTMRKWRAFNMKGEEGGPRGLKRLRATL